MIWTPSINMWAALGDEHKIIDKDNNKIDLEVTRCGFPRQPAKKRPPSEHNKFGGYTELTQNFEKGNTKIIIDHSMPEDIESIFLRNKNEQYWLPA